MGHSMGPWTAKTKRSSWGGKLPPTVEDAEGHTIATVESRERLYLPDGSDTDSDAESERDNANARIMAASLELLAAADGFCAIADGIVADLERSGNHPSALAMSAAVNDFRAAITKAEPS